MTGKIRGGWNRDEMGITPEQKNRRPEKLRIGGGWMACRQSLVQSYLERLKLTLYYGMFIPRLQSESPVFLEFLVDDSPFGVKTPP